MIIKAVVYLFKPFPFLIVATRITPYIDLKILL